MSVTDNSFMNASFSPLKVTDTIPLKRWPLCIYVIKQGTIVIFIIPSLDEKLSHSKIK